MNLESMIHRLSQPPSWAYKGPLLGGLLCLLLQLLKQRTSRLTHKKSHPTYWHISWRPSMPLPNAPSLPPEAKTTWIMLQHAESSLWNLSFSMSIFKKKKSTATEAGAVCFQLRSVAWSPCDQTCTNFQIMRSLQINPLTENGLRRRI